IHAELAQPGRRAAGRNDLNPMPRETGGKLVEPALVGKRNQRPADGNTVGHSLPLQLARRNCQPISPPTAHTSPTITSWVVRCGWPRPSIHRLSSILRLPPRQRKFHGGTPRERRIAPMPSAVVVTSIAGARWKRTA